MLMALTDPHTSGLHARFLPQTRTAGHHGLGRVSLLSHNTCEMTLLLLLANTRSLVSSWHLHLWPTFDSVVIGLVYMAYPAWSPASVYNPAEARALAREGGTGSCNLWPKCNN